MSAPRFRTRLTELFGIDKPILCGGMMWLSDANYVAACVNAGAMAFMTPRSFPDEAAYRDGLRRCFDLTGGKQFGVNIYVSARPEANAPLRRFLDIAIEEGVKFVETAGYSPKAFLPAIKDAGMTVVHKCTTLRHAQSAERAGVDAIAILGAEAGGHPGADLIGTFVQGALVPQALKIPVVLADGVLLASRMIVAEEIWAHRAYKKHLTQLGPDGTRLIMAIFNDNSRVIDTEAARAVAALEAEGVLDFERYRPHVQGSNQRAAYETGAWQSGTMSLGQSVAFADRIEPAAAILERIMEEADAARERLARLAE